MMLAELKRSAVLWNRRRLLRRVHARRPSYADWCGRHDTPGAAEQAVLQQRLLALPQQPVVALLLAQTGSSLDAQQRFLAALQGQLYAPWQLTVACAEGDDARSLAWWTAQAAAEPRLHLLATLPSAVARCTALLASVDDARTPWLAWADIAERWRPHALLLLVEAALHHAGVALVYADEDRLDAAGRRHDPDFKSDWDPDLLLSRDSIGSPALWRTAHLAGQAPFVALPAALQTSIAMPALRWHVALCGTAHLAAQRIVHVPHTLLHRTADAAAAASAAAAPLVQAHLDRMAVAATAEAEPDFDGVRVRFAVPEADDGPPWVTIIIPTRNQLHLLSRCVSSVLTKTTYPAYDIVIIDNGSDEADCLTYLQRIADTPRVAVRRDDSPFNFAKLNNAAVAQARGEFVALVNNDIEVISPGWLDEMVSLAARPGVGAVGARLWYGDDTLQHGGVVLGLGGAAGHAMKRLPRSDPGPQGRARRLQGYLAVTAACLVVRKASYRDVGGLDGQAFAVAFNDVDFCLKLAASGLRNLWTPHADLYHHESVSRGRDKKPANKARYLAEEAALQARWPAWLRCDPFYSPHLTVRNEDLSLAEPPRVSLLQRWFDGAGTAPTP